MNIIRNISKIDNNWRDRRSPEKKKDRITQLKFLVIQVHKFLDSYCEWLSSGFTSFVIFLMLCGYWTISIRGVLATRVGFTPEKLFLKNSPMLKITVLDREYLKPTYTFVTVYVTKCGNMSEPTRLERMKKLVAMFEDLPECKGKIFTKFWIRDYESFLDVVREDEGESGLAPYSEESIMQFASWPEYTHWGGFLKFNETTHTLSQFMLTVAYQGENQAEWSERLRMLKTWPIYEENSLFTDQLESMIPQTIQSSIMTLICMAIVCCVFMFNFLTVTIAVASITSICLGKIGVFGLMTLWGIEIDPISVSTLIMSIGLSVDFPAHVTFHYYRTGLSPTMKTAKERMVHTLSIIGFPLFQCSVSTILLVLSLLFVTCYMTEVGFLTVYVFIKAVVLVVLLGIVHALVAVPAILCTLSNLHNFFSGFSLSKIFKTI
ncbi:unnamed protein product [Enterobius vermicularis]|uniref:SSD domain-containing protein n=1 Tax=Enterobius vermicularis TaxID=51028 RepID=A0A0N4V0Y7_ENTVE|nr:unnamed protein product [Enterobius vermicularis]